jgi:hypothetical protein
MATMRIPVLAITFFIMALTGSFSAVFAASSIPRFFLGLGFDYARGDFDTDSTSTYLAVPLSLDWYPDERFSTELTVPFLYQSTGNTGYAAIGSGAMAVSGGRGLPRSGTGMTVTSDDDQSGLGDITLISTYNVMLDRGTSPAVGLSCYFKFPTADEDKGLGTGSFDWGPGLLLSKWLGDWQPFVEGRYIFQGASRAETGARDYLIADAGLGYGWSDDLYLALFSRAGTSTFDGLPAPLEIRLKTAFNIGGNNSAELFLMRGVSDGSPDYGAGLTFYAGF